MNQLQLSDSPILRHPIPSQNTIDRYLRAIFNHRDLDKMSPVVRNVRHIDKYASRDIVLTEAQRLGWNVFVMGDDWIIVPKNKRISQFKWGLSALQ